jgi:hypothetical protein
MRLDILFVEDMRNALLAADEAISPMARVCAAVGEDSVTLPAYLEGYRAALTTVALAFGLLPSVIAGRRETLEVETRTVDEALLTSGEDDASPSVVNH